MQWSARFPDSLRQKPLATIVRAAGKALLIVFLPFLLLTGLNHYFAEIDLDRRVATERNEMAKILSDVAV